MILRDMRVMKLRDMRALENDALIDVSRCPAFAREL